MRLHPLRHQYSLRIIMIITHHIQHLSYLCKILVQLTQPLSIMILCLLLMINKQLGKLHIKERDNVWSRFVLFTFYLYTHIFLMYLLPHFTQNFHTQELCMSTLTLETKHLSVVITRHFFGLTSVSHIQLSPIQDSLFVVLMGKLSFGDHFQHLIFLMTLLTIYLIRSPKSFAQIFVPTTLRLLLHPWEQMLIN